MTSILKLLSFISLLVGTPLLGMFLSNSPLRPYLAFPPTTTYVDRHAFSWFIFSIILAGMAGVLVPFIKRFKDFQPPKNTLSSPTPFPWWGWCGLGFLLLSWILAWSRFHWFQPFQDHTFTPLWISYILVINALTLKRTGHCLLREKPYFYLSLFLLSAGFWWLFEFLNRFVQNWYYLGSHELDATMYFIAATIPFSTVLPAVIGTSEYLKSFPRLFLPFQNWWSLPFPEKRSFGNANLILACTGLLGIGLWPNLFYPILWLAPLIILVGLQRIWGEKGLLDDLKHGNWTQLVIPGLAGLTCGFFWEMWNFFSLAHWKYSIPYVQAFHVFEMPILGYFGYLPFGITCIIFVNFLVGDFAPSKIPVPFTQSTHFMGFQNSNYKIQG